MGVIEARRRILLTTPHPVTTTQAPVASFDTDMVGKLRSAKFAFLPVQSGSGDPSPTNIRSISGWDGVTAGQAGVNLFDIDNPLITAISTNVYNNFAPKIEDGKYYNGGKIGSASGASYTVPVVEGATYTVQFTIGGEAANWEIRAVTLNENIWDSYTELAHNQSGAITGAVTVTVTVPSGKTHLYVACYSATKWGSWETNIQIELGSTATSYAPYTGSTYPVTWQSAGTIYGGYVDVCKGVVVAEWAGYSGKWQDGDNESAIGETLKSRRFALGYIPTTGTANNICNIAPYSSGTSEIIKFSTREKSGIGYAAVTLPNDTAETTDIQIVSKLATPITYAITPTIIKTLRGANNLWSNANGDTTITYWTH